MSFQPFPGRGTARSRARSRRTGSGCRRSSRPCGGRPRTQRERAYRGAPRVISSFAPHAASRHDPGVAGHGRAPGATPLDRAPHVPGAQPAHVARHAVGHAVGRADPVRDCRAASPLRIVVSRLPGSGRSSASGATGRHELQRPATACGAEEHRCRRPASGTRPGRSGRRRCGRGRARDADREVLRHDRRPVRGPRGRRERRAASRAARKSALIRFRQCAHARGRRTRALIESLRL